MFPPPFETQTSTSGSSGSRLETILVNPFFSIAAQFLDFPVYDCQVSANPQACINKLIDNFIDLDAKSDAGLPAPGPVGMGRVLKWLEGKALGIASFILDKVIGNLLLNRYMSIMRLLSNSMAMIEANGLVNERLEFLNGSFGWGEDCFLNTARSGYCIFQIRNLVALSAFGTYSISRTQFSNNKNVAIITTERDGFVRNGIAYATASAYAAKGNTVSFCMYNKGSACETPALLASDNLCGVPHSAFSHGENAYTQPFDLYWEQDMFKNIEDVLSGVKPTVGIPGATDKAVCESLELGALNKYRNRIQDASAIVEDSIDRWDNRPAADQTIRRRCEIQIRRVVTGLIDTTFCIRPHTLKIVSLLDLVKPGRISFTSRMVAALPSAYVAAPRLWPEVLLPPDPLAADGQSEDSAEMVGACVNAAELAPTAVTDDSLLHRPALDLEENSSHGLRDLQTKSVFVKPSGSNTIRNIMSSVQTLKAVAMDINPKLRKFYEAIIHKTNEPDREETHGSENSTTSPPEVGDDIDEEERKVESGGIPGEDQMEVLLQIPARADSRRDSLDSASSDEDESPDAETPKEDRKASGEAGNIDIGVEELADAHLSVTVSRVELAGKPRVVYVRLTFRGKRLIPVNPDEAGADRYETPLSYHALLFDTLKVDVYERSALLNTHLLSVHVGRARVKLRELQNLRGSTIETFPLFPRRLRPGESPILLGFITLSFDLLCEESQPLSQMSVVEELQVAEALDEFRPVENGEILPTPVELNQFDTVLSEDEEPEGSELGPDDSVSVMGDLGDPDMGSNFGSQVGSRAEGEEMVQEFMHYFGKAAQSTQDEFYAQYSSNYRESLNSYSAPTSRSLPIGLSSASLTHDPTVHAPSSSAEKGLARARTTLLKFDTPISVGSGSSGGGWFKPPTVLSKKTLDTINEMSNLAAAFFNHGWRISKMEFVWSITLISKWQNHICDPLVGHLPSDMLPSLPLLSPPRQRSKSPSEPSTRLPRDASPNPTLNPPSRAIMLAEREVVEKAMHFMKFAVATYGSALTSLFEAGKAYVRDFLRSKADRKTALTHLGIPASDILEWEFSAGLGDLFKPKYFVCWDAETGSIILCIRGTVNIHDVVTDLCAEYDPYRTGYLHRGIHRCARWMVENLLPNLLKYIEDRKANTLNIVGHSLGAAIGSIFAMVVRDAGALSKVERETGRKVEMRCWSFGCPPCMSRDLADEQAPYNLAFVNESDMVPTLCYGSMMDLRETIIKGAELLKAGKMTEKEKFDTLTEFIQRLRSENVHPKVYIPGALYHIHKLPIDAVKPPPIQRHSVPLDFHITISEEKTDTSSIPIIQTEDPSSITSSPIEGPDVAPDKSTGNTFSDFVVGLRHRKSGSHPWSLSAAHGQSHAVQPSQPALRKQPSLWRMWESDQTRPTIGESPEPPEASILDTPQPSGLPNFSTLFRRSTAPDALSSTLDTPTVPPSLAPTSPTLNSGTVVSTPAPSIIGSLLSASSGSSGGPPAVLVGGVKVPTGLGGRYVVERVMGRKRFESIRVGLNMLNNHFPNKYDVALKKAFEAMPLALESHS
ncbi:hypothetical protein HDU67_006317 [Dinochytrium kinnereticum]|nr:hypothetical protein HDU67_006317 [Dinochytrium kinnereticum]